ncbi:efflux transporter periplasmic adaptor subunit [Lysobacteraceae bacterium NML08-0793]|nr:efflux transporter periplasmic adaptor subunit [Xanthomonadaceae bacterium NML08-0793]
MKLPGKKTLIYSAIALLLVLLLAWAALRPPTQLVSVQTATRGTVIQSFNEEGKTRLKASFAITAPVSGHLQRITLEPGDRVNAGQVLALIAPATSTLLDARSRAQAEAEIRAGQSQQAAANQRIAAARAAHQMAEASLQRMAALQASQLVSRQSLDQTRAEAATATAELAAARAEAQAAAQRVAAARAVLAQEGRSSAQGQVLAVKAPVAGVVLRRPMQSAMPVMAGQVLMEIGDAAQLEIEADVLSSDAVRLAPGMQARVQRWGGEEELAARILRIEPGGFTKVSALGVEEQRTRVILDITSPHSQWAALGDAYRVELEFILQQQANTLQVPAGALFRSSPKAGQQAADEHWAVYRVVDGRARRTPVRIGLRSATAVQILDGLNEGDAVVMQPDERIEDGTRVQAH